VYKVCVPSCGVDVNALLCSSGGGTTHVGKWRNVRSLSVAMSSQKMSENAETISALHWIPRAVDRPEMRLSA